MDEINIREGFYFNIQYSPDENGYYAEIFDRQGKTLHITDVVTFRFEARTLAKKFIDSRRSA